MGSFEMASTSRDNDVDEESDQSSDTRSGTLATTRSRRHRTKVSYKVASSSEDSAAESSDDSDSDDENPLFAGLSKEEKAAMKAKMCGMQREREMAERRERAQSVAEIVSAFELNIGEEVSTAEAAFMCDFCAKHQLDINEKIEDEGEDFLQSMREMIEERLLQSRNQNEKKSKNKTKKKRKNDSDSEFDEFEVGDGDVSDSDSDFSDIDSDWENPLGDGALISDDEEYELATLGGGGRGRRGQNVFHVDGREYYAKGRLLLCDALRDTENFEGWSAARVQAWKNKEANPNAYYYRFNDVNEESVNGRVGVDESEHRAFMERVMELGVNVQWGTFSMKIRGRVGYQCSSYWRQMMKDGWVEDPNYVKKNGKFQFKRAKKGSIPDALRKYSFTVLRDPSGVFSPIPATHPKRPTDAQLTRYLSKGVRTQNSKKAKKTKKTTQKKKGKAAAAKDVAEVKEDVPPPPKKPQSAYFLFAADVRGELKTEFPNKKVTEIAKETGARWKAMLKADREPFHERAKKAKSEYDLAMDEYLKNEDKTEAANERDAKSKTSKKKKRPRKDDGAVDETEPDSKKRKVRVSEEKESALMSILNGITDLMTGEKLKKPAISPFGHVMEYASWCSILRQKKTKNKCPFTQNTLTRRSLVKLDAQNIAQYRDKIVNVTAAQRKSFKS